MAAEIKTRDQIYQLNTFGQRAADRIANGMGSWTFIITQTAIILVWVALNLVAVLRHWDPYPFILLNLLFSTQAAYAAPIIMMSQNRQARKDHLRDDHEAKEVEFLFKINQQQLEILHILQRNSCPPEEQAEPASEPEVRDLAEKLQEESTEIDAVLQD
jgi:uncharacterized membrane protein